MPGAVPVTGLRIKHISVRSSNKSPQQGTVEADTNIIARRQFKRSKHYEMRITDRVITKAAVGEGSKASTVFQRTIEKRRILTPGHIIGLIFAYLFPPLGLLVHLCLLSQPKDETYDIELKQDEVLINIDESGNIEDPNIARIVGSQVDLDESSIANTGTVVVYQKPIASVTSHFNDQDNQELLLSLEKNDETEARVNRYVSNDLTDRTGVSIKVFPQQTRGVEKEKGRDALPALPHFVKKFLASASFGGSHGPMQIDPSKVPFLPVPVALIVNVDGKKKVIRGSLMTTPKDVEITIKQTDTNQWQIIQKMNCYAELQNVMFEKTLYTTTVTVTDASDDNYHIVSMDQEISPNKV